MKVGVAALAALVSFGGCGIDRDRDLRITTPDELEAPRFISNIHSGPFRAAYLGRVPRYARTWFERQGVGDAFPYVLTPSPQVGVRRPEASMCRVSEDARAIRCAPSFGISAGGGAAHLGPNGWIALRRRGGESTSFVADLVHGRAVGFPKGNQLTNGSVDLDGSARVHAHSRILRLDANGESIDSAELSWEASQGQLLGPWFVYAEGGICKVRYVYRSGPTVIGEERALGLEDCLHDETPACWGFGHTAVRFRSAFVILSDDPSEVPRVVPVPRIGPPSKSTRTVMLCTSDGFISSTTIADNAEVGLGLVPESFVEERCNASGCTRNEPRLPSQYKVSAPVGFRTIALGIDDSRVMMKVGPPAELATAREQPLFPRRRWQDVEVELVPMGSAALAVILLHNTQFAEGIPGPDLDYDAFVLRVDADGTVESVEVEGEPSRGRFLDD